MKAPSHSPFTPQAGYALQLLAEAGTVLSSSLDYEQTLQSVATLLVPSLADCCLIIMVQEDGSARQVAATHRDPSQQPLLDALAHRYAYRADHPTSPVGRVLREGKAELLPRVSLEMAEQATRDPDVLNLFKQVQPRSIINVPLNTRERTLGVLALLRTTTEHPYGPDDLTLAEELGRRAALAVDNARLYHEAQEAISIRDRFLSIASHDLKTPLTSIVGYVSMLQRTLEEEEDRGTVRVLEIVQEEAQRLARLVDSLLDLSQLDDGKLGHNLQPMELRALVEQRVSLLAPTLSRHTLRLRSPEGAFWIEGDDLRLGQLLQNLLDNAIKYSPDGGTIEVRMREEEGRVLLEVQDEGMGIPASALPRLWDSYYRAPNAVNSPVHGLGIGLHTVQQIVVRHHGRITVESELGGGTCFQVALPLLRQPPG